MKEIGEKLKETRESMGISIEEVAEDLKLRPSQIENIEAGNLEEFKDVFFVKYFIRDYAKYLGLDYEEMVDAFNEYLFDYTSKISLEDVQKAKKKVKNQEEKKRIMSPYTIEYRRKFRIPPIVIYVIIALLLIVIGYLIISIIDKDNFGERDLSSIISEWR
ncbi:MAG: helix-turn-helix domain-containing protein [Mollicutes bacterium]|nr:helix-turn-helix domain-containing protein [Mollicutes bacterium]